MKTVFYVVGISLMTMFGLSYLMNFDLGLNSYVASVFVFYIIGFVFYYLNDVKKEAEEKQKTKIQKSKKKEKLIEEHKIEKNKEKKEAIIVVVSFSLLMITFFVESKNMALILNFNVLMRYVIGVSLFITIVLVFINKITAKQLLLTFFILGFLLTPIFSFINRTFIDNTLNKKKIVVLNKEVIEGQSFDKFYVYFNWNNQEERLEINNEDVYDEIEKGKSVDLYIKKGLFTDIAGEIHLIK